MKIRTAIANGYRQAAGADGATGGGGTPPVETSESTPTPEPSPVPPVEGVPAPEGKPVGGDPRPTSRSLNGRTPPEPPESEPPEPREPREPESRPRPVPNPKPNRFGDILPVLGLVLSLALLFLSRKREPLTMRDSEKPVRDSQRDLGLPFSARQESTATMTNEKQ